jgi:hypothetical protein
MSSNRDDDRRDDDRNDRGSRWDDERDDRGSRRHGHDSDRPDRRDLEEARSKVKGPAIALMVTVFCGLLSLAGGIFQYFVALPDQFAQQRVQIDADPNMNGQMKKDMHAFIDNYEKGVNVALPIQWVLIGFTSVLTLIGAVKMKNLSSRGWARTSAILSMIPCFSGCCLLGLPFGIWALMVLANPDVKRGFDLAAGRSDRDDDLR